MVALTCFILGLLTLLWAAALTQFPWYPKSRLQYGAVVGGIAGLSALATVVALAQVRTARIEIDDADPARWRGPDLVLGAQATAGLILLLLVVLTVVLPTS